MGRMNVVRAGGTVPTTIAVVVFSLSLGLLSATTGQYGGLVLAGGLAVFILILIVGIWQLEGLGNALMCGSALTLSMIALRARSEIVAADVLLAAAMVPLLIVASRRPFDGGRLLFREGFRWHLPVLVLICLVVFGGLAGSFAASDQNLSLAELGRFAASSMVGILLLWIWNPSRRMLEVLCWCLLAGATVNAALGFVMEKHGGRAMGLGTHPNHYGLAASLACGIALGFIFTSTGWSRKLAAVTCLTILGVGILDSGSRAALLGVFVTVMAFLMTTKSWKLVVLALVMGGVALATINYELITVNELNAVSRLRGDQTSYLADQERLELARVTLESIAEHPIVGNGFANAKLAHSIYLQLVASAGVLGAVFAIGLIAMMIRALLAAKRSNDVLAIGVVSSYAGYLAAGAFTNILWDRYVWVHLAVMLTLVARAHSTTEAEPLPRRAAAAPAP
jgi:O-antigen ligase